jgi:hypothetical protein
MSEWLIGIIFVVVVAAEFYRCFLRDRRNDPPDGEDM